MSIMEPAVSATLMRPRPPATAQTALSIIIVSYNCRGLTIDCLKSVYETTRGLDHEVVVVDNASADGTIEAIGRLFPGVKAIELRENVGFGRGCNVGARHAKGRYLLFLNPDTLVRPGAIEKLVRLAEKCPDAGIWGGQTLSVGGEAVPGAYWRFPTLWSTFCIVTGLSRAFPRSDIFNREAYGRPRWESVREVEVVSGCLLMISREMWDALDGFDPVYFLYSEEVDLCLRARRLGARPLVSPDIRIVHYGGRTQDVRSDRLVRLLKGKRTFMLRHWSRARQWVGGVILLCWPWSRYWVFRLSGFLLYRPGAAKQAAVWGHVWRRRREWMAGYPVVPS